MIESLAGYPFFFKWQVMLIQSIGFLVFFCLLKTFLFDRLLRHMRDREDDLKKNVAAVDRQREAVRAEQERYEKELAAAEKAAYERLQEIVRGGVAERTRILTEAHDRAHEMLLQARERLRQEGRQAVADLESTAEALAGRISDRLWQPEETEGTSA